MLTNKQKKQAVRRCKTMSSFFLTVDLMEGLLDLLLAAITVYVHSQHQCLDWNEEEKTSRKTKKNTGIFKKQRKHGRQEAWKREQHFTCCRHKQSLPPPAWREKMADKKKGGLSCFEKKAGHTHLHLEDILLAHPGTASSSSSNAAPKAQDDFFSDLVPELSNQSKRNEWGADVKHFSLRKQL